MGTRRVVTGHTPDGTAVIVSDEEVTSYPIGSHGSAVTSLWGRDDPPNFPDDGARPSTPRARFRLRAAPGWPSWNWPLEVTTSISSSAMP